MFRETLGDRHPHTLTSSNNLGLLLQAKGDLDAAEPLMYEALEVRRSALGNRHPHTLNSINNLGVLMRAKGDLAAAEPLLREALEGRRATLSIGHPDTLTSIRNLRMLLIRRWLGSAYAASCAACFAIVCIMYLLLHWP